MRDVRNELEECSIELANDSQPVPSLQESTSMCRTHLPVLASVWLALACQAPEPLVVSPLPPGVEYPWRTLSGLPNPGMIAALHRSKMGVGDAVSRSLSLCSAARPSRPGDVLRQAVSSRASPPRRVVQPPPRVLDLNTAAVSQLQGLPGVGPALASRIIAGRPFARVDELVEVRGIGPHTLDRVRRHVRVGSPE